jgi:hypothetical protein
VRQRGYQETRHADARQHDTPAVATRERLAPASPARCCSLRCTVRTGQTRRRCPDICIAQQRERDAAPAEAPSQRAVAYPLYVVPVREQNFGTECTSQNPEVPSAFTPTMPFV